MQTETATEQPKTKRTKRTTGRKDNTGQEAIIDSSVIAEREDELVRLFKAAGDAAEDLSSAIKKAAEDSGYNSAAVRKFIAAKAGDSYDAERKKVVQLALIFSVD